MKERDKANDNAPGDQPGMLGSVSLEKLIDYYERQLILMHRLLQDEQREVERLARKLEER